MIEVLPPELRFPNIIPLNVLYHEPARDEDQNEKDVLYIVFKDQDSGNKYVHSIISPKIEIYIVKPECRDYTHMRDMIDMDMCNKITVPYKYRWFKAAKELGLPDSKDAKSSPYIFGADIPIETWYLMQFIKQYPVSTIKPLSIGKLDIESDVVMYDVMPDRGEAPINAVTYTDMTTKICYTIISLKCNIPVLPKSHREYDMYQELREQFEEQAKYAASHQDEIIQNLHDKFDEIHPGFEYRLIYVENEENLLRNLFSVINLCKNDFTGIWNLPYDMGEIIERANRLGIYPDDLIIPRAIFPKGRISFREDNNPVAHKRRHTCKTYTITTFIDDMVNYAGIRVAGGALESLKLTSVAQKELKDDKYDYSEVGGFRYLYYKDLMKFTLYNIKDVLLLNDLETKTNDTATIYSRLYRMATFTNEAFTSTKIVWNSLIMFMNDRGIVHGTNRNKGKTEKIIIDYSKVYGSVGENVVRLLSVDIDTELKDSNLNNDSELEEEAKDDKKPEKYPGALVLNTQHMSPTSTSIMGVPNQFIHDFVADLDIKSEYPSEVCQSNISNETFVGRVFLKEPDNINIPIPEGYQFKGDDKLKFRMHKSNYMLEVYTQRDWLNFGTLFLNLPTAEECLDELADIIK